MQIAQIENELRIEAQQPCPKLSWLKDSYGAGREFLIPSETLRRELAGESPVKLWREHRGLTQQELAKRRVAHRVYRALAPARQLCHPADIIQRDGGSRQEQRGTLAYRWDRRGQVRGGGGQRGGRGSRSIGKRSG